VDTRGCESLGELLLFFEQAVEFALLHILHQKVDIDIVGEETVEFHQIAVVEEVLQFDLAQQLVLHHILLYDLLWDLFEGVQCACFYMFSWIDFSELTLSLAFPNLKISLADIGESIGPELAIHDLIFINLLIFLLLEKFGSGWCFLGIKILNGLIGHHPRLPAVVDLQLLAGLPSKGCHARRRRKHLIRVGTRLTADIFLLVGRLREMEVGRVLRRVVLFGEEDG
jgi:hypothetical protein